MHLARFALFSMAALAGTAAAQSAAELDLSVTEADIAPSVVVREGENRTIEEYKVGSQVYMVKVTPSVGAPYYLVDEDGSGDMEYRRTRPYETTQAPMWTLMRW